MNETFELSGEYIALCDLLKACNVCDSGGAAKHFIAEGNVRVDGQVELRKTCKIRVGQQVSGDGFCHPRRGAMNDDDFDPPPEAPEPPPDDACCGSGCDPCIWDSYNALMTEYRAKLAAWELREAARQAAANGQ